MAVEYSRDVYVRWGAAAGFLLLIAGVGAAMMAVTSSPAVKGAALLWLPAALQLVAGVWLGPLLGFVAAGVGAQLAGAIAYGGWGPADWIMNFVAGGLANGMLPALLFRLFRLDPGLDRTPSPDAPRPSIWVAIALTGAVVAIALLQRPLLAQLGFDGGPLGYAVPLVVVLGAAFLLRRFGVLQFSLAVIIAVFISFVSACIGVVGALVGGQTFEAAVVTVGVGWFLGDAVSSIIGLYVLSSLTPWARNVGIAPLR